MVRISNCTFQVHNIWQMELIIISKNKHIAAKPHRENATKLHANYCQVWNHISCQHREIQNPAEELRLLELLHFCYVVIYYHFMMWYINKKLLIIFSDKIQNVFHAFVSFPHPFIFLPLKWNVVQSFSFISLPTSKSDSPLCHILWQLICRCLSQAFKLQWIGVLLHSTQ